MLNSLYIKNYRNLKDFKINSLVDVNLFTGKNNTGKSSILEAISLYLSQGNIHQLKKILEDRDELYVSEKDLQIQNNVSSLTSIFTERKTRCENKKFIPISIGDGKGLMTLRFVRYIEEGKEGLSEYRKRTLDDDYSGSALLGFEIKYMNNEPIILSLQDLWRYGAFEPFPVYQFIGPSNVYNGENGSRFDSIALTDREAFVIDALKIIEPNVERITFIEQSQGKRTAVIKLSNSSKVLPLRSMGDGINRILTIILAMVNASNGYLLIDEFENGLHYTVQVEIWELIFNLSQKLNVQVFATTHSNDSIRGFEQALNMSGNTVTGKLIRLDNINGEIKEIEYSAEELNIATNRNIETR